MTKPKHPLPESVRDVIALLGGTVAVSRIAGVSPQAVSNWKRRGMMTSDLARLAVARHASAEAAAAMNAGDLRKARALSSVTLEALAQMSMMKIGAGVRQPQKANSRAALAA